MHTMHTQAQHVIRAAKHKKQWGSYAARQYCINKGIPLSLYRLACQLEAVK